MKTQTLETFEALKTGIGDFGDDGDGATALFAQLRSLVDRRIEEDRLASDAASSKTVSGLYRRILAPSPTAMSGIDDPARSVAEAGLGASSTTKEEMRLDVDGRYSLNVVSGTLTHSLSMRVEWIARVTKTGPETWTGTVSYKNGDVGLFPYTSLKIEVNRDGAGNPRGAAVEYSGGGQPTATRLFKHVDSCFRSVEFEFDNVTGIAPTLHFDTASHPDRPPTLPSERLTIQEVFTRTGFRVGTSGAVSAIPLSGAGPNSTWSDAEMHDAMQTYWSRFASKAQWAAWVFHAPLHDQGASLGGIMFDDIGPNHRQGTAIFTNSFIAAAPAGDPAPAAWVNRMKFWCAIHEMGHQFNLAHAWQKALGTPWVPQINRPESRSFMNYPFRVSGSVPTFFRDFEYRFDDDELLFMRHAPERFVEMGNAAWFDNHGFRHANVAEDPQLALELRVNRDRAVFEFLEPVVVELKLTNVGGRPIIVDEQILADADHSTIVIKRHGHEAKQFLPFARRCWQESTAILSAGESSYGALFLSAGKTDWYIAEPGRYTIQLALHLDERDEDIVSNPLEICVRPPADYSREVLAQDYFTLDVGRVLTFDGTRVLDKAQDVLQAVVDECQDSKAAIHARVALGLSAARPFKSLQIEGRRGFATAASAAGGAITVRPADERTAREYLAPVLIDGNAAVAKSLGHIEFNEYAREYSSLLAQQDERQAANQVLEKTYEVLDACQVKPAVLAELRAICEASAADVKRGRKPPK